MDYYIVAVDPAITRLKLSGYATTASRSPDHTLLAKQMRYCLLGGHLQLHP